MLVFARFVATGPMIDSVMFMRDCTRGVRDTLYHSRYHSRDRHYECDSGINDVDDYKKYNIFCFRQIRRLHVSSEHRVVDRDQLHVLIAPTQKGGQAEGVWSLRSLVTSVLF